MKHPCKGCKSPNANGRVFCPILKYELALEGCNRQYNRTPKEALAKFEQYKNKGG